MLFRSKQSFACLSSRFVYGETISEEKLRMVDAAEALGADAIVGARYASSSVMQGAAEVVAYGTAVKFL